MPIDKQQLHSFLGMVLSGDQEAILLHHVQWVTDKSGVRYTIMHYFWSLITVKDMKMIITARKRRLRRLCFPRCLSTRVGGLPHCMLGYTPHQADTPLAGAGTPSGQTHIWAGTPPWQTPPGRYIPLGRHPPSRHPPCPVHVGIHTHPPVKCMLGYGQQVGGTHPPGMHSCFCIFIAYLNAKTCNSQLFPRVCVCVCVCVHVCVCVCVCNHLL